MEYLDLPIAPPLQSFMAKSFAILRNDHNATLHFGLVPRIFPAFIFNFPDSGNILNKMQIQRDIKQNGIYYGGVGCEPVQIGIPPKACFIVVLIYPNCTGLFFKEDAKHFTENQYLISGTCSTINSLNNELANESSMNKRWDLIQKFFLTRAMELPNTRVTKAVREIFESKGMKRVTDIAKDCFTGARNLTTLFDQHVGISPKKLSAAVRFSSLMSDCINHKNRGALLNTAWDYEYYDLSHLNKDFKRFTNLSPEKYLKQEHSINKLILD